MIELHPEKKMPLYEQLYNALAQDIRSGALQPGKALPGRRTMAAQLGISTNTVDTAYQMLAAEGLAGPAAAFLFRKPAACCTPARSTAWFPPQKPRQKIQSTIKTIFYTICQPAV